MSEPFYKAKYIKRWKDKAGKWRYEYPKKVAGKKKAEVEAPHSKAITSEDQLESQKMYTLWQKIDQGGWVVERSFQGHYIKSTYWDHVKQSWGTRRPFGVFPQSRSN